MVRYYLGLDNATVSETVMFLLTISFVIALAVLGVAFPEQFAGNMEQAFDYVLTYFGWWYMLLGFILATCIIAFAMVKYGRLRIGGEDAEKEFGLFSWFSMVFTVGFASAVIFFGVAQPVAVVNDPPPGFPLEIGSIESVSLAFMYTHNIIPGLLAWYLPFAVAFGIIVWGKDEYRVSTILTPILDREKYGSVYWITDIAALVAIVGGLATSLGFIAWQLQVILDHSLGVGAGWITYAIFGLIGLIFLLDVYLGLRHGIRNAARATVVLIIITMGILLAVGPTMFTLNMATESLGVWLNYLPTLMMYSDPVGGSGWPQAWTGFWWAWWAAWGIFVGSFVARISRGRTVREMIIGVGLGPAIFLFIQHAILGGWALAPENFDAIVSAYEEGGEPFALAEAINITPAAEVLAILFVMVLVGYLVTTLDSAVYMVSSINLGTEEPNARNRAVWGIVLAALGIMTLELPEAAVMETFVGVFTLPFSVFFLVMIYASYVEARRKYYSLTDKYGMLRRPDPDHSASSESRDRGSTGTAEDD